MYSVTISQRGSRSRERDTRERIFSRYLCGANSHRLHCVGACYSFKKNILQFLMQIHRLQGALARAPPRIPARLGPPAAPPEAGRKRGRRLLPAPPRAGTAPETAAPGPRLPAWADLQPEAGAEAARAGGGAEAVLQAEAAHRAHEQSSLKVHLLRCQFFYVILLLKTKTGNLPATNTTALTTATNPTSSTDPTVPQRRRRRGIITATPKSFIPAATLVLRHSNISF